MTQPNDSSRPQAPAPHTSTILCRFGELFLKQGNRSRFEGRLLGNMHRMLADIDGARIRKRNNRIVVDVPSSWEAETLVRLSRVFGLVSLSPVASVHPDMETIQAAALEQMKKACEENPNARRSFKVASRRSNKRFPLTSYEISAQVGAAVVQALEIPVDVHEPATTIGIEVGDEEAFVYARTVKGPGGLPVGSAGHGLLLLSGGIDSPVAAWLAAKRGLSLDAVYFHSPPFVGEQTVEKIRSLGRALRKWHAVRSVTVVNFTEVQKKLRDTGKPEMAVVLYRRMMMRIADRIADQVKAQALVTGESLSQVASQTIGNLTTIEDAAQHLVLRPLITHDKVETIRIAEDIGTYDISIQPHEDCCSLFVPRHPATSARVVDAQSSERGLNVQEEADKAAQATSTLELAHAR